MWALAEDNIYSSIFNQANSIGYFVAALNQPLHTLRRGCLWRIIDAFWVREIVNNRTNALIVHLVIFKQSLETIGKRRLT